MHNTNQNPTPAGKNHSSETIFIPGQNRMKKLCQIAKTRKGHPTQKGSNGLVEVAYMKVLKQVKQLLASQPQVVFERDQRDDSTENAFIMHSFLCKSFYFQLECSITFHFQVEYSFNNCPWEQEIRRLLQTYPLDNKAKEVKLNDFNLFYDGVLRYQSQQFVYNLKV